MSADGESKFEAGGIQLYAKTWTPSGPVRAKLVFVHGFSEHINRYNSFFSLPAAEGIQVYSWDQRGWGRSALNKSDWGLTGKTPQVIADVASFIKHKLPSEVPVFVMGHSMGGGEVITLAQDPDYRDLVSGIRGWILESPLIGFSPGSEPSSLKVFMGRLAGRLLPHNQLKNVIPPELLSRDPEVVESVRNDELCHDTGTLEGLASLLDRTAIVASGSKKLGRHVQSVWLAHGTADGTCSHDAAVKWLKEQVNVDDRASKSYEGAYHQLHSDLCKDEFAKDLVEWILKRSGSPKDGRGELESRL